MTNFSVKALPGIAMIEPGDNLVTAVTAAATNAAHEWNDGDIVCVAQKIVSKSERRQVLMKDVVPGPEAIALAAETDKDPRLVELVLQESDQVLRKKPGILIVRHRLGFVCANAGIDQSNIDHTNGELALLLPVDADASAAALRDGLQRATGKDLGVIITDSHNRPWRLGTLGTAIGAAGITVLDDYRGGHDIFGRELKVTLINRADAIAAAATLVMGETTEKIPAAIVSGFAAEVTTDNAAMIRRPLEEDLFT